MFGSLLSRKTLWYLYHTINRCKVAYFNRKQMFFPHSWLITGFVTRVTQRVPLVEQELVIRPKYLSSDSVFNGVRVARSLVFCAMLCRSLFVLLSFFLWPMCCLSIDLRILITWYIQTLLMYAYHAMQRPKVSHFH
jgi:hypothetical protein